MTSETPPAQAALLRRAWYDVAGTTAPQLADLPLLLDQRLSALEAAGTLDEASLLAVAEDAAQYALEQGAGDAARALSKRLRRAIYEFLLALDAVNPAETDPAAAAPPPSDARSAVALMPGDVNGGDDTHSAGATEVGNAPESKLVEAPPVPLWEQMSAPSQAREVYRVASREVTPVADAAPTAEDIEATEAPEVGPDAEATLPGDDPGALVAEADDRDIEAILAEVFDGAPQDMEVATFTPAAETLDTAPEVAAGSTGDALDAEAEAVSVAPTGDDWDQAVATEEPALGMVQSELPEIEEALGEEPEAALPVEPVHDLDVVEPVASAEPEPPATEAEAAPTAVTNGVKPPRELLRVPRQFRRLPPLPGRRRDEEPEPTVEAELPGEPAVSWMTAVPEAPASDLASPAPDVPAEAAAPETVDEDDMLGVPALPWSLEAEAETAPAAPDEVAPSEPAEVEEEEFGLPFAPLAGAELAADVPEPAPAAEPMVTWRTDAVAAAPAEPPVAEPVAEPVAQMWTPPAEPTVEAAPPPDAIAPAAHDPFAALRSTAGEPLAPASLPADPFAPAAADPFAPAAPTEDYGYPDLPAGAPGAAAASKSAEPWTPVPIAPSAAPFPIAPREGFHLTDPGNLEFGEEALPAPPPENPFTAAIPPVNVPPKVRSAPPAPAPAAPAPAAPSQPAAGPGDDAASADEGGWKVRQSPRAQLLAERMAQKRREEAARAAFEAASVADQSHRGRKKRRGGDEALPDLDTARRQLAEHLRKKRGSEAGALLQRLAQEMGGRDVADLGLDAGDRCRALGQGRSATNCYLAAWRADPLYETPLWRLSDVCLNEQDIDLAVGYLERIADLMRSRGDDEGAIGVYRKIAMIAPERQDVRDVIRLAKTTGRLDV